MKYKVILFLIIFSFQCQVSASFGQDYQVYDVESFALKGNVKDITFSYLDSTNHLVFDNDLTHFNSLEFNKTGKLVNSLKTNVTGDTLINMRYIYNEKNNLIEQYKYLPSQTYLAKYNGLEERREFHYNQKELVSYQLKFANNSESAKDSSYYTYDNKRNLIKEYNHQKGNYTVSFNRYNTNHKRISSVYTTANPTDQIIVWKWEFDNNLETCYQYNYNEADLRKITASILSELIIKLEKENKERLSLEGYLDQVYLQLFTEYIINRSGFNQLGLKQEASWSEKFNQDPTYIKQFTKKERLEKITFPNRQTSTYEYNKYGDIILQKTTYPNDQSAKRFLFKYEYDKFNNWVVKDTYFNKKKIETIKRAITYF